MKRIFVVSLLILISLLKVSAQDTLKINLGFMLAPQAGISLYEDGEKGFIGFSLLHQVTTFNKGKWTIIQMYTLNSNSLGFALSHQIAPRIGVYGIFSKRIFDPGNYLGTGMSFSVANGRANGFVELGSSLIKSTPTIYIGIFIPFTFKVK